MFYKVVVQQQGRFIADHQLEAPDALTAINRVEAEYGEAPQVEFSTVELEDGTRYHLMVVNNWHGYSFHAIPMDDDKHH